jgi:hypothetical protein
VLCNNPRQNILSQSIGGSLRLPLLQNGACPFPCTPLLRVLMRVTQTDREVLSMFPGFRIMAVSMSGLEIAIARIPSMPTEMVNLPAGHQVGRTAYHRHSARPAV